MGVSRRFFNSLGRSVAPDPLCRANLETALGRISMAPSKENALLKRDRMVAVWQKTMSVAGNDRRICCLIIHILAFSMTGRGSRTSG